MRFFQKSLKLKILAALIVVFAFLMMATTMIAARNEQSMVMELAIDKTRQIASSYFDNVNTLMLSGGMPQRHILREKLLETEGIIDARLLRAEPITQLFGPGNPEQVVRDELDQRGLQALDTIIEQGSNENGRTVSVVIPMQALPDYKGTNCLMCHVVEPGTVLGAVRVDYSLEQFDSMVASNLMQLSLVKLIVMAIGLVALTWFINQLLLNPLHKIRSIMGRVAEEQDLTHTIEEDRSDEIGDVGKAYNQMLSHFAVSLNQVREAVIQLTSSSSSISHSAEKTVTAANEQRQETDSVASAITRMELSAEDLSRASENVAEASRKADTDVEEGTTTTTQAIDGIKQLVGGIENASQVIQTLDERSEGVGSVLDVIRGIAEQTNLLALNAAIEAARAGEQGRGFAVVADEVRTLATRSHESTQEIEKIVEQLQQGAKHAVEVMNEARDQAELRKQEVEVADNSLKLIADRVSEIHQMNEAMNRTVLQQNEITRQVQDSILNISNLSESTTRDAEQTSQQGEDIVALAKTLDQQINKFSVE